MNTKRRIALITFAASCLWSAVAAGHTLGRSLEQAFADGDGGFSTLRSAGATYEGILTLERLPDGSYLAEIGVSVGERTLRYPVKLERAESKWTVVWQPDAEYAAALSGIAKSGALPAGRSAEQWAEVARMPALGVVATRARVVTPFGEVDWGPRVDGPPGALDQYPDLVRHGQRWVTDVLEEDPGPAGFDLLLDRQLDWLMLNTLMFNLAAVGLYQLWVVTDHEGRLHQLPVSAPVDTVTGPQSAPPVAALYPLDEGRYGVRISSSATPPESVEECAPGMSLCVSSADELVERLEGWLEPGGRQAIFAAVGVVGLADAVRFMAAFIDYMGLPSHRILVGYIEQ